MEKELNNCGNTRKALYLRLYSVCLNYTIRALQRFGADRSRSGHRDRIRNAWAFYGQHNGEYLLPRYAGGKGESQYRSCKLT